MPGSSGSHTTRLPSDEAWHVTICRMLHPGWYPDELAHAGPEHLNADHVARDDVKVGPSAQPDRDVETLIRHVSGPDLA